VSELFPAEQIVHRQRYWQQGNEVLRGFAVDQSACKWPVSDS
jgi:hypothetical protein